ncbi:MAG: SDR family NAD(P)-dependent oxidoreductase, partial [Firmicutes bacterium]|nr:SDR family NAD(P)-dependent oxidoreductase [Bacillota bacterium]
MEFNFGTDLSGKVAVVTGAGGVLCSVFSKTLARAGAKVALLGRTAAPIETLEKELTAEGLTAKAYQCNVLDKARLEEVRQMICGDLGPCDILINGAGGNDPKASTGMEYYDEEEAKKGVKTFFDLDEDGIRAVFDLNYLGVLLTTQVFAKDMIGRQGCSIINISSMNAFTPLTKIPAYSGAKASVSNLT